MVHPSSVRSLLARRAERRPAPASHASVAYRCPSCRQGALSDQQAGLASDASLGAASLIVCEACGETYLLRGGGIPDLVRAGEHAGAVAMQEAHFDEEVDPEFEIERPRCAGSLYHSLMDAKFRRAFSLLPVPLEGLSVLDACCGSGMASEYYASRGALVAGVDVSHEALLRAQTRARRRRYPFRAALADVGNLPFADGAFDVVAVHDGLHHVEEPERAIDEMARVARLGVIVIEPAAARVTQWAVRRGLALEVEDAGNRIRRFRSSEVELVLAARGFDRVRTIRYLMWYPHHPPAWFRWFDHPAAMVVADAAQRAANAVAGDAGNKLTVVGWRTRG